MDLFLDLCKTTKSVKQFPKVVIRPKHQQIVATGASLQLALINGRERDVVGALILSSLTTDRDTTTEEIHLHHIICLVIDYYSPFICTRVAYHWLFKILSGIRTFSFGGPPCAIKEFSPNKNFLRSPLNKKLTNLQSVSLPSLRQIERQNSPAYLSILLPPKFS